MVSWFKEEFGHVERLLAAEQGVEPETLFDDLVNAVPPGSMGLMLQPYWSPGLQVPGPEAKGAIIGFGDVHTRAHLYRASLKVWPMRCVRARNASMRTHTADHRSLRVAGGGSQCNAAMQITADVFGLPAARPHTLRDLGAGCGHRRGCRAGIAPRLSTAIAR